MPPMYDWACTECGKEETLIKPFDESDVPPPEMRRTGCSEHNWVKKIGVSKLVRGPNWNGSKGNWLFLLAFLPWTVVSCVSGPKYWRQSEHSDFMADCRASCNGRMKSYIPYSGECVCLGRK